ncbi:restless-like transposase [Cordyceps javanica]|uniref:Restless-like transposase n=1 Tax=Cordyceps javanica TaxID=43265 RepID=A0A545UL23_9HYPO|nr:restless-like transposase [Cordyceps javanica]TQW01652.1 restless-like transposase [Cordyceps javanica]
MPRRSTVMERSAKLSHHNVSSSCRSRVWFAQSCGVGGIPELVERCFGENIAAEILDIVRSFGVEDKMGCFTLDHAANNDTAMGEIAPELHFDPAERCVRCVGHILNLVMKSILFGKDVEAFEDTVARDEALARAAHDTWMRRGPVGEAHDFAI